MHYAKKAGVEVGQLDANDKLRATLDALKEVGLINERQYERGQDLAGTIRDPDALREKSWRS